MTSSPLSRSEPLPDVGGTSRSLTVLGYYSFVMIGWQSLLLPSLIRSMEHDFHQTDAGFAVLYFIANVVYAAAAFGGGFLTERFGRRSVLVSALVLCAIGAEFQAGAMSWFWFVLAAAPGAWGGGVIDGGINALFLDLYRDARGGALNFLHLFFGLGALIGPVCIGLIVTAGVSWRIIAIGTGIAFLLAAPPLARIPMPSGRHDAGAVQDEAFDQSERSLVPFIGLAMGIGLYVAAEVGVSSWLVQLLSSASLAVATGVLSAFWGGLSLGRLLSRWVAEVVDYYVFTIACIVLASLALVAAVLSPWLIVSAVLFALTGMFFGPIFPMIMALGGGIYPHRLATLSGSLTTAAVVGGIVYPPLMGLLESRIGLSGGMIGAALLGIPMAGAILLTRLTARRYSGAV
jgi:fucose permease